MPILDVYGRELDLKKPPEGKLVTIPISDFVSNHPTNQLTPQKLGELLRQAESGYIGRQMELAEDIEEKDWHIGSVLQTRRRAVAGLPWVILPMDDDERSKEITNFVVEVLRRLRFVEMRRQLMDAIFKGIAVLDLDWRRENGKVIPVSAEMIHFTLLDFSDGVLKIRRTANGSPEAPPAYKTIQHRHYAKAGTTMRGGLVRSLAWAYVLKHFAIRSWLIFAEACGMPLRIGKYPESATDEQKRILKAAVKAVGIDFAAIMPEGMEVEFIEATKNSGQAVFEPLTAYIDSGITRLVLGQTLTTQGSEGGYGSRSLGEVHETVAQNLLEDDSGDLEETLQGQLIEPLVMFNFGHDAPMPQLKLKCEPREDLQAEVEIDEKLVKIGLPLSKQYFYDRYGRPKPAEGEEILEVPRGIGGFTGMTDRGGIGGKSELQQKEWTWHAMPLRGRADKKKGFFATSRRMMGGFEKRIQEALGGVRRGVNIRANQIGRIVSNEENIEEGFERLSKEKRPWEMIRAQGEVLFGLMMMGCYQGWERKVKAEIGARRRVGEDKYHGELKDDSYLCGDDRLVAGAFNLVPARAADFFRLSAFWVSDVTDENVLADGRRALQGALEQGYSWNEVKPMLAEAFGSGMESRLETIFRTNLFQAYNGGRFWSGMEGREAFPYWQYFTIQDDRVRPNHAALHGKVYRKDDPIWQSIFPPNGFNCRCTVEDLDEQDLEKEGLGINFELPTVPDSGGMLARPDFGWDYNPANWEKMFANQIRTSGFMQRVPEDYGLGTGTGRYAPKGIKRWDIPAAERMDRAREFLKFEEGAASIVDFEGLKRTISEAEARRYLMNEALGSRFPLAMETLKSPDEIWGAMEKRGSETMTSFWMIKGFQTGTGIETVGVNCVGGEIRDYIVDAGQVQAKRKGILVYLR